MIRLAPAAVTANPFAWIALMIPSGVKEPKTERVESLLCTFCFWRYFPNLVGVYSGPELCLLEGEALGVTGGSRRNLGRGERLEER